MTLYQLMGFKETEPTVVNETFETFIDTDADLSKCDNRQLGALLAAEGNVKAMSFDVADNEKRQVYWHGCFAQLVDAVPEVVARQWITTQAVRSRVARLSADQVKRIVGGDQ
jgi:hypothetical protein